MSVLGGNSKMCFGGDNTFLIVQILKLYSLLDSVLNTWS